MQKVVFETLPIKTQRKVQKLYDYQKKKHKGITDEEIMLKIGKKFKFTFDY